MNKCICAPDQIRGYRPCYTIALRNMTSLKEFFAHGCNKKQNFI